jgi:tetratricopeptide (TPR) repeat protein
MLAQLAMLRLHLGQAGAYRDLCRTMIINQIGQPGLTIQFVVRTAPYGTTEVSSFRTGFDPDSAALMAWTCSLAPGVDVSGFGGNQPRGVTVTPPSQEGLRALRRHSASEGGTVVSTEFVRVSGAPGPFGRVVELAQRAANTDPRDYVLARALGAALYRAGHYDGAVRQLNAAAALRPIPSPSVWLFLALAHHRLGHRDEARRHLEQAMKWAQETRQRKPDDNGQAITWARLPWTERVALDALRREAEKELLGREGPADFDAALAFYRDWARDEPTSPLAHHGLGVTLMRKGDLDNAMAAFRKAIEINGRYLPAHAALGSALMAKGEPVEAVLWLREAVKLPGSDSALWYNLGKAHANLGEDREAAAAFREAIRPRPPQFGGRGSAADPRRLFARDSKLHAEAHCELAFALQRLGQPAEALKSLRTGHDLGSRTPGWPYPSAEWLKRAEHLAALEKGLPAILKGGQKTASPEDALELSAMCQARGHPVTAARLAADALQSKSPLGDDMGFRRRFLAACAAAQAACGSGEEAAKLTDAERESWRGQALTWLDADLAVWSRRLEKAPAKERGEIASTLQRWQRDPALGGVRDEAALAKLPNEVRDAWRKLWQEVDVLRRKALR